jgi:hypothetical protein
LPGLEGVIEHWPSSTGAVHVLKPPPSESAPLALTVTLPVIVPVYAEVTSHVTVYGVLTDVGVVSSEDEFVMVVVVGAFVTVCDTVLESLEAYVPSPP